MNIDMILKSDVLDIIFENRNKIYGAYPLRKFYNKRLVTALSVMLGCVLIICSLAFIPKTKEQESFTYTVHDAETGIIKKEEIPKPKEKPQLPATTAPTQEIHSRIQIVDSVEAIKPIKDLDENKIIDNATTGLTGEGNVFNVGGNSDGGGGFGNRQDSIVAEKEIVDVTVPQSNPDVQPAFPGGMNALRKFLEKNLHNPKDLEPGELVSVKVKFVVGYDGKLQKFEVVEDGGEEFNKEVIRVLKKMPDWIPGKSNGQNVAVYNVIPVKFITSEE